MNKQELQKKLRANYNRDTWKEVLLEMFPIPDIMFEHDRPVPLERKEQQNLANHIAHFGEVELGEDTLIFLEVELKKDSINLAKNRVGLRRLIDNEVVSGLTDAALISYYQPDTDEWRITFYSERYGWDEDGNTIKEETHPKRYTYVVGPDEFCKTAAGQLIKVVQKGAENTLEHVLEAFSVQKVSKEFFREYKEQYDKFVGYLTGEVWKKNGVQEVDTNFTQLNAYFGHATDPKKEARDFAKKLLGRIVFLYFVQKKKWIGSKTPDFKDGDTNFIYNLFHEVKDDQRYSFYSQWLSPLFFETLNKDDDHSFEMPNDEVVYIPFLNGGLFEMDETDQHAQGISLPADLFSHSNEQTREVPNERGFLDFLSAYNFTIHEDSPGDHTIAVDPEMLGHIFENLLEDNKDKGAYYTPKPIVHYMCQESLIEYLLTELTTDDTENSEKEELRGHLEDLIKKQEAGDLVGFTEPILKSLKKVKVCDPAIGSGAFPMGILQEIYQAVETLHHLSPDNVQAIWELPDEDWHPAEVKKQIIQNSIYGVDIEKGAVDIARLRFWLSLIVDEEEPAPLPNLDYKIVVGNSLLSRFEGKYLEIGWDITGNNEYEEKIISIGESLAGYQESYFQSKGDKKQIESKIRELKIDLIKAQLDLNKRKFETEASLDGTLFEKTEKDVEKELAVKVELEEFKTLNKRLDALKKDESIPLDYFDWKLDFPEVLNPHLSENPGFDIVIANPPYLRVQEIQKVMPEDKKILEKKYKNAKASYDLANLFFELAVNLGKPESSNCFIFPHKFFNSASTKVFRDYLMNGKYIDRIAHFGANMIFNDADTYTCITLFSGKANDGFWIQKFGLGEDYIRLMNQSEKYSFVPYEKLKLASKLYGSNQWILFNTDTEYDIFEKCYRMDSTIEKKFAKVFQGIATGRDHLYVFEGNLVDGKLKGSFIKDDEVREVEPEMFKPLLKGRDVHRYDKLENDKYILFPYKIDSNGKANEMEEEYIKDNFPNTFKWLKKTEREHRKKDRGSTDDQHWYRFARKQGIDNVEVEKLMSMEICSNYPNVALDEGEFYHSTTVYSWVKKEGDKISYQLYLSIANSQLLWWFLLNTGDTLRGDARRFKSNYLNPFPLPKSVSEQTDQHFKERVEEVISAKAEGKDTTALEQHIDTLVYKLYNLTWEEVQVVDPEFGLSEEEYEAVGVEAD